MIELKEISKIYTIGDETVYALDHASMSIQEGEFVSIIGPSGSGKSTMMNIIGCLDVADEGEYILDGISIEQYSERELARIRNHKLGFIFQNFNLLPRLTAEENVELPLLYQGVKAAERKERVRKALEKVELSHRMHHRPTEKSLNKITDSNTVSTEEMIAFLEHLDQCDFCLDQMIEEEIRNTDQPAPDYLAEQILNRAAAPDVQAAKAVRTTSRKMQLFYYGLRTATGMIAALFLLFVIQQADLSTFSGVSIPESGKSAIRTEVSAHPETLSRLSQNISAELSRSSDKLTGYIRNFSNKILNGGDLK